MSSAQGASSTRMLPLHAIPLSATWRNKARPPSFAMNSFGVPLGAYFILATSSEKDFRSFLEKLRNKWMPCLGTQSPPASRCSSLNCA